MYRQNFDLIKSHLFEHADSIMKHKIGQREHFSDLEGRIGDCKKKLEESSDNIRESDRNVENNARTLRKDIDCSRSYEFDLSAMKATLRRLESDKFQLKKNLNRECRVVSEIEQYHRTLLQEILELDRIHNFIPFEEFSKKVEALKNQVKQTNFEIEATLKEKIEIEEKLKNYDRISKHILFAEKHLIARTGTLEKNNELLEKDIKKSQDEISIISKHISSINDEIRSVKKAIDDERPIIEIEFIPNFFQQSLKSSFDSVCIAVANQKEKKNKINEAVKSKKFELKIRQESINHSKNKIAQTKKLIQQTSEEINEIRSIEKAKIRTKLCESRINELRSSTLVKSSKISRVQVERILIFETFEKLKTIGRKETEIASEERKLLEKEVERTIELETLENSIEEQMNFRKVEFEELLRKKYDEELSKFKIDVDEEISNSEYNSEKVRESPSISDLSEELYDEEIISDSQLGEFLLFPSERGIRKNNGIKLRDEIVPQNLREFENDRLFGVQKRKREEFSDLPSPKKIKLMENRDFPQFPNGYTGESTDLGSVESDNSRDEDLDDDESDVDIDVFAELMEIPKIPEISPQTRITEKFKSSECTEFDEDEVFNFDI